jgi:hypothetical protein
MCVRANGLSTNANRLRIFICNILYLNEQKSKFGTVKDIVRFTLKLITYEYKQICRPRGTV